MYKYSQRLVWDVPPNAFTQSLNLRREAGEALLDLTISNPTEAFNSYPHAAIRDACCQTIDFTYQPNPLGQEQARSAVVELYKQRGVHTSTEQLALTASTSEAYSLLFQLFGDPEAEILAPLPSYPLFDYLAALASVKIVPYRLTYDGAWFIDFENLLQKINGQTRALVVVNPNNPTGSFLKAQEAEQLVRIASEFALPIISDEVFTDYSFHTGSGQARTFVENNSVLSFSLDGLSKTAAMPQMKLGWIAMNGPSEQVRMARSRLELLLDTYLSVATPVQCAAPRLLQIGKDFQGEISRRTLRNLNSMVQTLESSAAHVLHSEGGWSAIVQLPRVLTEEAWVTRLLNEGVLVQPGYFFDMPSEAFVVVSLITSPADFDEGMFRLKSLVSTVVDDRHGVPA